MIRLHLSSVSTMRLMIAALLDYTPDARWAVLRTAPQTGFTLVMFGPTTAARVRQAIADASDAHPDEDTEALMALLEPATEVAVTSPG